MIKENLVAKEISSYDPYLFVGAAGTLTLNDTKVWRKKKDGFLVLNPRWIYKSWFLPMVLLQTLSLWHKVLADSQ